MHSSTRLAWHRLRLTLRLAIVDADKSIIVDAVAASIIADAGTASIMEDVDTASIMVDADAVGNPTIEVSAMEAADTTTDIIMVTITISATITITAIITMGVVVTVALVALIEFIMRLIKPNTRLDCYFHFPCSNLSL